ncbi:unnamed protein product [Vitrella brassicaformis CCMP3155]|uniref:Cyclic nucleotide-binding domain-containing protein n=2 Tax=Vitrella brassicaformis TaxID=1169539 RepID=A0A0G4EZ76_VITBC|nr:unnamed protein product [Vitrella brassicaformis CCMP3155]|eukprot:CEM04077.1 unnamed protein product [Vitrella brassicaformis CCMP3155]
MSGRSARNPTTIGMRAPSVASHYGGGSQTTTRRVLHEVPGSDIDAESAAPWSPCGRRATTEDEPLPEDHTDPLRSIALDVEHWEMAATPRGRNAHRLFQDGCKAKVLDQFTSAIKIYKKCLEEDPRHFGALINLATSYMRLLKFDKALALFDTARHIHPRRLKVHLNQMVCLFQLGRYEDVLSVADRAVGLSKEMTASRGKRKAYVVAGEDPSGAGGPEYGNLHYWGAETTGQRAETQEEMAVLFRYRGLANFRLQNFEAASEDFIEAKRLSSTARREKDKTPAEEQREAVRRLDALAAANFLSASAPAAAATGGAKTERGDTQQQQVDSQSPTSFRQADRKHVTTKHSVGQPQVTARSEDSRRASDEDTRTESSKSSSAEGEMGEGSRGAGRAQVDEMKWTQLTRTNLRRLVQEMARDTSERNLSVVATLVKPLRFFRKLRSRSQREDLLAEGSVTHHPANSVVFRQGDLAEFMYVILSGICTVSVKTPGRPTAIVVNTMYDGQAFGETSITGGHEAERGTRGATVTTAEDTYLLQLDPHRYLEIIARGTSGEKDLSSFVSQLKRTPFFAGCASHHLSQLPIHVRIKRFSYGGEVLRRGRKPDGLYILTQGLCRLVIPPSVVNEFKRQRAEERANIQVRPPSAATRIREEPPKKPQLIVETSFDELPSMPSPHASPLPLSPAVRQQGQNNSRHGGLLGWAKSSLLSRSSVAATAPSANGSMTARPSVAVSMTNVGERRATDAGTDRRPSTARSVGQETPQFVRSELLDEKLIDEGITYSHIRPGGFFGVRAVEDQRIADTAQFSVVVASASAVFYVVTQKALDYLPGQVKTEVMRGIKASSDPALPKGDEIIEEFLAQEEKWQRYKMSVARSEPSKRRHAIPPTDPRRLFIDTKRAETKTASLPKKPSFTKALHRALLLPSAESDAASDLRMTKTTPYVPSTVRTARPAASVASSRPITPVPIVEAARGYDGGVTVEERGQAKRDRPMSAPLGRQFERAERRVIRVRPHW